MKKSDLEKQKKAFWKIIEKERRASSKITLKQLSKYIGVGENYLSAVVNGRKEPSFDTTWKYLIAGGFDVSPMMSLKVKSSTSVKPHVKHRNKLISLVAEIEDKSLQLSLIEIIAALKKLERVKTKK